jgi:hypothetical protein
MFFLMIKRKTGEQREERRKKETRRKDTCSG